MDLSMIPNGLNNEAPTFAYMDTMDQDWSLNDHINSSRATVLANDFTLYFGPIIDDSWNDNTQTGEIITVAITDAFRFPNAPVFDIQIEDEIMTVVDKVLLKETFSTDSGNRFPIYKFTVLRGQYGTIPKNHALGLVDVWYNDPIYNLYNFSNTQDPLHPYTLLINGVLMGATNAVFTNTMVVETVMPVEGGQQTYWKDIPPTPTDVIEDAYGNPTVVWKTRDEYVDWFKKQIYKLGGEVKGNQYRFPLEFSNSFHPDEEFKAEDALSTPAIDVVTVVLPKVST
jgi:hypothetical protein